MVYWWSTTQPRTYFFDMLNIVLYRYMQCHSLAAPLCNFPTLPRISFTSPSQHQEATLCIDYIYKCDTWIKCIMRCVQQALLWTVKEQSRVQRPGEQCLAGRSPLLPGHASAALRRSWPRPKRAEPKFILDLRGCRPGQNARVCVPFLSTYGAISRHVPRSGSESQQTLI